ncbi:homoprotocatechuate degradation operon regulator HpaR [Sulfitobacter delicatus]|uniref:Homoprotocatechuate degradation operon regulator, HpaR n=1 Tax=Sulfitobacter delicatus TaxID=218672 RepID=A0A1G7PC57_9RHOB|nr:homoprotocatechuate degradation operon regulator HpaR [Sulfitobacter delicatus]SDF83863.1 homoprotocatechuate degradation operon regulator, HpaR [Sulfitobacter delicatus]
MATQPPLRRTARTLPIALLRARERVMGPIREILNESGISEQKYRVIRVLDEAGPMEQTALANASCLLLPSLTRMLRAMEEEGLLTRASDPNDGRKSIVTVTDAGQQILQDHADDAAALFADLDERFGKERMEKLLDMLEDLVALDMREKGER